MGSFWRRTSLIGATLFFIGNGVALAQTPASTDQPPPSVETSAVKLAPVTRQGEFVGTVIADQQVQLMARVEGFLDSVGFTEGSFIKAGQIAFEIEKDGYQAALDSARAALEAATAGQAGAEANLKQAEVTLTRQVELLRTANVSQSTVDQATATRDTASAQVDQAKAQISQAQANVKTAELNLSYTDIKTPISGRIGKMLVTPGNLVSPSTGTLATVVQTDPIRVQFSISDRDYLTVVNALKPNDQGVLEQSENYKPKLRLSDGTIYESPGKIAFLNNTIDSTTGTIAVFAEFPNPRLQLVPGQFVTVTVQSGEPTQLPIVPAAAVQQDRDGAFVFVLDEGNRAVIRRVSLGPRVGVDWSVTSGLANGEVIITNGIQKVRAGIVVNPTPAATGN
ncbi:efflux RND transporter periplasmic adaptor subunit [Phyllobacterium brassicacearum]|uniref:efflux RND transporter periplasmic adaptor subunit n=1 Tax=Phyllobacterium brassicacearum TaxID=314235 RepID=UPI0010D8CE90|nr:efflux RND transporter periplasmic adaptor subunit [Phyllobacterium brassicacearum]TDQ20784.1 membrane fusion protein (multidrug efflux system) [Phyllobacterium brassicacearum]